MALLRFPNCLEIFEIGNVSKQLSASFIVAFRLTISSSVLLTNLIRLNLSLFKKPSTAGKILSVTFTQILTPVYPNDLFRTQTIMLTA